LFATDDSIVAIATPPGRGGIGIVRISGARARAIAGSMLERPALEPRRATYTRVRVDEVVATYFPAPHSYTGEDVVEIGAHGSPVVLRAIVQQAIDAGARLAGPGEFTLRAFLNGKRDLIQAEAVADLIAAATPLQARVAFDQLEGTLTGRIREIDAEVFDLIARLEASLDFPDEGYHFIEPAETARRLAAVVASVDALLADARRGRVIREGVTAVIAGRPNVGKSSVFNMLTGVDRAIVTPVPGTTRDLVTEQVEVDGLALTLVDTAGWRATADVVEREGVARATEARGVADLILLVLDQSEPLTQEDEHLLQDTASHTRIIVANKSDLSTGSIVDGVHVSARTGAGLDDLRRAIVRALTGHEPLKDTVAISNARHIALLVDARESLLSAQHAAGAGATPEEFVLADLQAARAHFDDLIGTRTSEDVLRHIFERFCIGK
jgi:tRNA modification GTPase